MSRLAVLSAAILALALASPARAGDLTADRYSWRQSARGICITQVSHNAWYRREYFRECRDRAGRIVSSRGISVLR